MNNESPTTILERVLKAGDKPVLPVLAIACPKCGSDGIGAGWRDTSRGAVERRFCRQCRRHFSIAPLPHRQYTPRVVLEAVTAYNLGWTLDQTRRHVAKRFRTVVPTSTIHSWLGQFAPICTFHRLRKRFSLSEDGTLESRTFEHQQEYEFKFHRLKLNLLAKRLFPQIRRYLWFIADNCPNDLFQSSGARCSDGKLPELDLDLTPKDTNAVPLARLGLVLAKTRRGRHEAIQRFMLANDSATVAVEVPVYLYPHEAPDLTLDGVLTGHIDVLQIRGRQVWILDYKPEARLETKAKFQLYLYARALSVRTGIPMRRIGLAYFDDRDYFQVKFPATRSFRSTGSARTSWR